MVLSCVIQYSHGMRLKFGHWLRYCLCLMLPLFWYLNSCRGFHLEIGSHENTSHKQEPLMGRPRRMSIAHKYRNCEFVTIFWYRFFWPNPAIKSTHQVIQKNKVESQLFHVSQVLFQPRFSRCVLSQTHASRLNNPPKKKVKIKRTSKKKRLDAQVFKLDLMFVHLLVGKHIEKSEWNHHLMSWVFC